MFTGKPHATGCTVCGNPKVYSRGLCEPDYRQLKKELKRLKDEANDESVERAEAVWITQGWILPRRKGGRPRDSNPFESIANLLIAEAKGKYTRAEVDRVIAIDLKKADQAKAEESQSKRQTLPKKDN